MNILLLFSFKYSLLSEIGCKGTSFFLFSQFYDSPMREKNCSTFRFPPFFCLFNT